SAPEPLIESAFLKDHSPPSRPSSLKASSTPVMIRRGNMQRRPPARRSDLKRSGAIDRIRFSEGSFAAFASIIAQSQFYAGYDSAGQHAAAAAGTALVSIFAGAPSLRFRAR